MYRPHGRYSQFLDHISDFFFFFKMYLVLNTDKVNIRWDFNIPVLQFCSSIKSDCLNINAILDSIAFIKSVYSPNY